MSQTHGELPGEMDAISRPDGAKNLERFSGVFLDENITRRNEEKKISGSGSFRESVIRPPWKPPAQCDPEPNSVVMNATSDRDVGGDSLKSSFVVINEKDPVSNGVKHPNSTPAIEFRPPRNNIESGYLTKGPKAMKSNGGDESGEVTVKPANKRDRRHAGYPEEGGLGKGIKMSSMEKEAMRERLRMTLLKQCSDYLEADGSSRYTKDTFRRVFTEKELLERLFQLFDEERNGVLLQEEWVEYLKLRLTGEKQIDFAEQVESVAYVLCGEEPITLEKFSQIFKAKGIVDKIFRLIDEDGDGLVTQPQIMEFIVNLSNSRPRTGLDQESLQWLEKMFRETVGDQKEIGREEFNKILLSKNPFFTDRVFQIFDKDNNGTISLEEFLDAMHQFAGKSSDDKIRFLFKVYDLDGDGLIQHRELQHVMRACMEENGMKFSEEQVEDLTMAMFEDADTNNRGAITYEALKNQLEKHGGLLENLTISIDRWLVPAKPKVQQTSLMSRLKKLTPYQLTRPYMKNNYVFIIFVLAFMLLNVVLFVSRSIEYRNYNGYVIMARACGQCLNFNCMFVLVLMLRHCITFLRTRGFSTFLPLDHHIYLHKLTGVLIFIYSVVHTIMHLMNFGLVVQYDPVINAENFTLTEWVLTSKPGRYGLISGCANPTGVLLIIILLIMFVCSQAFVRRGGCFEIFYWTHLLYIPFWVLVIFHGPNFWKWFVVPGILYLIERVVRLVWLRSDRGKTYISSGLLLPSRVTHLVIKRPPHFDYFPGDYVFVNIPAIAKYEWHPFTISSAPEQEDYMWLHIRGVGQWTNRLYDYFDREQEKLHNVQDQIVAAQSGITNKKPVVINRESIIKDNRPVKRLQATIQRKFSNRDKDKTSPARIVSFKRDSSFGGITNDSFTFDSNEDITLQTTSEGDLSARSRGRKITPEKKLHMLLLTRKQPLEKSLSMPDMQNRVKKRERLLALREYARSESERSFDEAQMRRARLQSLGLAYLSPQNKSLAQSFRYMRNKPTIIAFKTPSLENCEAQINAMALAHGTGPYGGSPDKKAEEGRSAALIAPGSPMDGSGNGKFPLSPMNYPVAGKPLESSQDDRMLISLRDSSGLSDPFVHLEKIEEIYIDGPYGAPSNHIFRAQHAVLIATGIGVTPFASILQSIMHRYWKARHTCPNCKFSWASDIPQTVMNLRKVDFFWINRDQRSFEWFVNLLSQLEIEQAELGAAMERFLEMHMYITSALQRSDMKAVGLQLALDLLHEKEKRDLITGLKTRTNAGRPNWDKVFKQLLDQKKGKITVFYCGPPQLGRSLRIKCDEYGFNFRKEVF